MGKDKNKRTSKERFIKKQLKEAKRELKEMKRGERVRCKRSIKRS